MPAPGGLAVCVVVLKQTCSADHGTILETLELLFRSFTGSQAL